MSGLLEIRGLVVEHSSASGRGRVVRAVAGVDLDIPQGGTVALVGESGCGKSTLARTLLGLHQPAHGSILLRPPEERRARDPALDALLAHHGRDGALDLATLPARRWRPVRRLLGLVFQDPRASLHPGMAAWKQVAEPLAVHGLARGRARRERAEALLARVGLPADSGDRLPATFSGGQCQRIALARALALRPVLLVLDEAVAALDVSVQARVLQLLTELREEEGLAWLFISHDLAVVRQVAARTAVMYLGRIVEEGATRRLFRAPRHPYTRALLAAAPIPDPQRPRGKLQLRGAAPAAAAPPSGCRFHPRCPVAEARCAAEEPPWREGPEGDGAACFLAGEADLS